jgi:hypothetical protein
MAAAVMTPLDKFFQLLSESMELDETRKAIFKSCLIEAGIVSQAPAAVAPTPSAKPGAKGYHQYLSARNKELIPSIPDWDQRRVQIKSEWDAIKASGKTHTVCAAASTGAAAASGKVTKASPYNLFTKFLSHRKDYDGYKMCKDEGESSWAWERIKADPESKEYWEKIAVMYPSMNPSEVEETCQQLREMYGKGGQFFLE